MGQLDSCRSLLVVTDPHRKAQPQSPRLPGRPDTGESVILALAEVSGAGDGIVIPVANRRSLWQTLPVPLWEIDLHYDRKLMDSEDKYLAVTPIGHSQIGYLRHRNESGLLVVAIETDARDQQPAIELAMVQAEQLWVHSQPPTAEFSRTPRKQSL